MISRLIVIFLLLVGGVLNAEEKKRVLVDSPLAGHWVELIGGTSFEPIVLPDELRAYRITEDEYAHYVKMQGIRLVLVGERRNRDTLLKASHSVGVPWAVYLVNVQFESHPGQIGSRACKNCEAISDKERRAYGHKMDFFMSGFSSIVSDLDVPRPGLQYTYADRLHCTNRDWPFTAMEYWHDPLRVRPSIKDIALALSQLSPKEAQEITQRAKWYDMDIVDTRIKIDALMKPLFKRKKLAGDSSLLYHIPVVDIFEFYYSRRRHFQPSEYPENHQPGTDDLKKGHWSDLILVKLKKANSDKGQDSEMKFIDELGQREDIPVVELNAPEPMKQGDVYLIKMFEYYKTLNGKFEDVLKVEIDVQP